MVAVKWRILIWLAVVTGVIAAAGLGADVVAAGPVQAERLAGVMTGFCELGALALGVAGWSARRRDTSCESEPGPLGMPEGDRIAPTAGSDAAKYVVDAHRARGVQVGEHATQHNHFGCSAVVGKRGRDR
jgi:hypothetical protein